MLRATNLILCTLSLVMETSAQFFILVWRVTLPTTFK